MSAFAQIETELALIGEMQAAQKRVAMVYQYDAKMTVAAYYGLTLDDVNLPFPEWAALRDKYETDSGEKL
jgi:hypothetical protein